MFVGTGHFVSNVNYFAKFVVVVAGSFEFATNVCFAAAVTLVAAAATDSTPGAKSRSAVSAAG